MLRAVVAQRAAHAVCEGGWPAHDSDDSDAAHGFEAWVDGDSDRTVHVHFGGPDAQAAPDVSCVRLGSYGRSDG